MFVVVFGGVLLVCVVLVVVGRVVNRFAVTPRQAVAAWLMVPPVMFAFLAVVGLVVSVGAWLMSPSLRELWAGVWFAGFGAVCLGVAAVLYLAGGFRDTPVDQEPRVPTVTGGQYPPGWGRPGL